MQIDGSLRSALEKAYEVFDSIPFPKRLETSPLRDGGKILRTLAAAPLRHLTSEQIGPYAGWAITTVGSERDYRHFLPRILELAVEHPTHLGLMAPVIAGRIAMGKWFNWPVKQRAAVLNVFRIAFERTVEAHPDETQTAPEWLCGLVRLERSVDAALAFWRNSMSANASLQLALFATTAFEMMAETGDRLTGFWDEIDSPSREKVRAWAVGIDTKQQLIAALPRVRPNDRWMMESALSLGQRSMN